MGAKQLGKTLNSKQLNQEISPLRRLNNYTNLFYIAGEYLTLAAILIPTIAFLHHYREAWGLAWFWNIPAALMAIMLVGVVQHRLAGLTHEASHYILFKNRRWNELASDLFCIFPLFATTEQYRLIHLGHHQYVNDWEKDPELINLGKTRSMDQFPMTKWQFIYHFYIRIFWPPVLLRYLWDNIYVTAVGRGRSPYLTEQQQKVRYQFFGFRLTTILGVLYIATLTAAMRLLAVYGTPLAAALTPFAFFTAGCLVVALLPEDWFYRTPFVPVYSVKTTSMMRLAFFGLLIGGLGWVRFATSFDWAIYFHLLWVVPIFTSFPYVMLLRDIYQHANADDGKLTNSRVFICGPLIRWAFFIYGQGVHLTHHIFPTVPHYNLMKLHRLLQKHNEEYRRYAVECHGVFSNRTGHPTILDVMEIPTVEPAEKETRQPEPASSTL